MSSPTRGDIAAALYRSPTAADFRLSTNACNLLADVVVALLAEAPPAPIPDAELDELQRAVKEELDGAYAAQSTHWSIRWLVRQRDAITDLRGRLAVARHLQERRAAEAPKPEEPDELSDEEWEAFADAAGFGAEAPQPRHVPVEGYWWSTGEERPYANLGASRKPAAPNDTPLYRLTDDTPPEAPQPRVLARGVVDLDGQGVSIDHDQPDMPPGTRVQVVIEDTETPDA